MIREKLYRDPIHDLIALDKDSADDRVLMDLIDTPEMQRLRRIRQLGLASLAYQGAEHSRFTHSLGAMWIATRILGRLGRERDIPAGQVLATRCAALLHDVGHGPLSHVFEQFMNVHHEEWTRRVVLDPGSDVNRVLARHHAGLPDEVVAIVEGRAHPPFLGQIISSQLDADRFDYLLRDSAMTGVKYGVFDFERLLHVLRLDDRGQGMVVAANGLHPVEKYLHSRYHMYAQVYLHKTVRAGEAVLGRMLLRAADLAAAGRLPHPGDDEPMGRLLARRDQVELADYTEIDDDTVYACMRRWRRDDDTILADLASRVVERRLFKSLDVSRVPRLAPKVKAAKAALAEAGFDPKYYFTLDESGDVPYRPYDPKRDKSKGRQHILIETPQARDGLPYHDIHDVSPVVAGLSKAGFVTRRAMFPETAPDGTDLRSVMHGIFFDGYVEDAFFPGG